MVKPNFFIVGASKAGTTSLWIYLKEHPEIYMPENIKNKEPSYFCNLMGPQNIDNYLSLFAKVKNEKAVGEASTNYISAPESPQLIRNFNTEAKIIISLRNPVDRAFSLYNWMVSEGYEWLHPFEKALEAEEERLHNPQRNNYYDYLYFRSGSYYDQIKRYINIFPRKQIHMILLEELKADPIGTIQKIYGFLGVDTNYTPHISKYNVQKIPISPRLQFFLKNKLNRYLVGLKMPGNSQIMKTLYEVNFLLGKRFVKPLSTETKQKLQKMYEDDIKKTSDLIGRNLESWLQDNCVS